MYPKIFYRMVLRVLAVLLLGGGWLHSATVARADDLPILYAFSGSWVEGSSGFANQTLFINVSPISATDITVDYATSDLSATAGTDYTSTSGTLTIPAGLNHGTITISINGDTLEEASDEQFRLTLSNPSAGTQISSSIVDFTILDDDASIVPVLTISDVSISEGNVGTQALEFTILLSEPSTSSIGFDVNRVDGSATVGEDYYGYSANWTLSPGNTSATFEIEVIGDTVAEIDETFQVQLSNPRNATIGDDTAIGTILDDDAPPGFSIHDLTVIEGTDSSWHDVVITVTLDPPLPEDYAYIDVSSVDGSAVQFDDFQFFPNPQTIEFEPGQESANLVLQILGDSDTETDESFELQLSNPIGAPIADGSALISITNDDGLPFSSVSVVGAVFVIEGNNATTPAAFVVTLSPADPFRTVSMGYASSSGSAVSPADYQETSGILTFAAGETTKTIDVLVNGDTFFESDETFNFYVYGAVNATISSANGLGIIVNDDQPLIISLTASNSSPTVLGAATTFLATANFVPGLAYTWDFGDGSSGSGATLAHTYAMVGTYAAVVTATGSLNSLTTTTPVTVTRAPLVNAGADRTVIANTTATLQGTASDPDGDALSVLWTQLNGPAATLNNANTLNASFTVPNVDADLTFRLTATDTHGFSASDSVAITICPTFPRTVASSSALARAINCFNLQTDPGAYAITLSNDIVLTSTLPNIDNPRAGVNLALHGDSHSISGNDAHRLITIMTNTVVSMDTLTLTHGYNSTPSLGLPGAGIYNAGNLTLSDVVVSHNRVNTDSIYVEVVLTYVPGAGIVNNGTLNMTRVSISGNNGVRAAGLLSLAGQVEMTDSWIDGNVAYDNAAGIFNHAGSLIRMVRSTVTNNQAIGMGNLANPSDSGVGIGNAGSLEVVDSLVAGNAPLLTSIGPRNSVGGGIANRGILTITRSTISENKSAGGGGGIINHNRLTVTDSTISGNDGAHGLGGLGGGIHSAGGTDTIINTTLSGNTAIGAGGIIASSTSINNVTVVSHMTITNSTIVGNHANINSGFAGGFHATFSPQPIVTMANTLIAANTGNISDCYSPSNTGWHHNVISASNSFHTCGMSNGVNGNIVGVNPLLGVLANNSGGTQTHLLLAGSPAIDTGSSSGCPATDQRGVLRPQGAGCDIGAVEAQAQKINSQLIQVSFGTLISTMTPDATYPLSSTRGVLTARLVLRNNGASLSDLYYQVKTLGNNNWLLNASGGPSQVGGKLRVANSVLPGGNNSWDTTENLTQDFRIGMMATPSFQLRVDVYRLFSLVASGATDATDVSEGELLGSYWIEVDATTGAASIFTLFLPTINK